MRSKRFLCLGLLGAAVCAAQPQAKIVDIKHYSQVFGEERNVRLFLPPGYDQAPQKRYPVIYFFHGWGQAYDHWGDMENGDIGGYNGDTVSAFVGKNDVIVVRWDGYNPRQPGEKYRRPYNIGPVETERQFPLYFPELVAYIDSHYRTLADRDHRATSGLSMGGFMSFLVSGKYPQLVGSASDFMGSSEFVVGPKGFPVEYRHTEMFGNYEGLRTRIVMGSRDFIRWYHRRMNAVWDFTRPHHESEIFDSEHGTPGIARTFDFHMAAFRNPLPKPELWHHIDLYPSFEVWDYAVSTDRKQPGFTILENVSKTGFRSSVREWVPDGAVLSGVKLSVTTAPLYRPGTAYRITDVTSKAAQYEAKAGQDGRLHFELDGAIHEIGITESAQPLLTVADWTAAAPGRPVHLKLTVLNKGSKASGKLAATVSSPNPGVSFCGGKFSVAALAPGAKASGEICFQVADPQREIVKFEAHLGGAAVPFQVPLRRDAPEIAGFRILDGKSLPLWQKAVEKTEPVLGSGNGDGIANPGERIAVAIPDGERFRTAELFTSDPYVDNTRRVSDYWGAYDNVGASEKYSLPLISPQCPAGHEIVFFVRYQLPNKPEHTLKEGVVRIQVK